MSRPSVSMPISDADRIAWLRLIRSENVGPVAFRRLLARYGAAERALEVLPELARRGGRAGARICTADEAAVELARARSFGARPVLSCEPDYPEALTAIEDPPPVLYVLGDLALLRRPMIAIVGSRNASLAGRRFAEQIAHDLGCAGLVIVSGLARGIDAAAHTGALSSGTVAVVAGGIDIVYPEQNRTLQHQISERGAVVGELAPGTFPQARHFPRRNRLISGLAVGVIVVEASPHSGSLITARMALDQGREVFAVPGSPLDPRARGSNDLIRQGATLTESADDVLRVVSSGRPSGRAVDRQALEARLRANEAVASAEDDHIAGEDQPADAEAIIDSLLSPTPVTVDEIVRGCHLSAATVHTILLDWELAGRLERHPGNKVARAIVTRGK